jgi:hypothetical protein
VILLIMDKYAGSKIAKTLYLKPRTNMKNYEVDFSKQYGNPKTRLKKLGSIIVRHAWRLTWW